MLAVMYLRISSFVLNLAAPRSAFEDIIDELFNICCLGVHWNLSKGYCTLAFVLLFTLMK